MLTWPVRLVYGILAGICFLLAMLGIALPGLPTTPFLLLMSFFLIRVSPRLHAMALRVPLIGKPLRDWEENRGVRPWVKVVAFSLVAILIVVTWIWRDLSMYAKIIVTVLGLIGLVVVYRLPTVRDHSTGNEVDPAPASSDRLDGKPGSTA